MRGRALARSATGLVRAGQVGVGYAGVVVLVTLALQALPRTARDRFVLAVSTDPDSLQRHPVRALLLSPFVVPAVSGLWLLAGLVLAFAVVQRRYDARRLVGWAWGGHAALSVGVAVLLERGETRPETAVGADVGVSYALAVAAGVAVLSGPRAPTPKVAALGAAEHADPPVRRIALDSSEKPLRCLQ